MRSRTGSLPRSRWRSMDDSSPPAPRPATTSWRARRSATSSHIASWFARVSGALGSSRLRRTGMAARIVPRHGNRRAASVVGRPCRSAVAAPGARRVPRDRRRRRRGRLFRRHDPDPDRDRSTADRGDTGRRMLRRSVRVDDRRRARRTGPLGGQAAQRPRPGAARPARGPRRGDQDDRLRDPQGSTVHRRVPDRRSTARSSCSSSARRAARSGSPPARSRSTTARRCSWRSRRRSVPSSRCRSLDLPTRDLDDGYVIRRSSMSMSGRMLRYARSRAKLTQRELAQKTGIPQETIARIERGRVDPRIGTLDRLLEGCGFGLEVEPRLGIGIDRTQIRELLTANALGAPGSSRSTMTAHFVEIRRSIQGSRNERAPPPGGRGASSTRFARAGVDSSSIGGLAPRCTVRRR